MRQKRNKGINLYTRLIVAFIVMLSLPFHVGAQNPNPNSTLDSQIQNDMMLERFPGASTIIIKNGKIVWVESYGYADVEKEILVEDTTVFLLASLSKVFTGTAAMQLHDKDVLDLDVDINNYLPFQIHVPNFLTESISLRQLMTHTSSINDNGIAMDLYYDYPDPTISLADCIQRYFSTTGADYDANANFVNNSPGTYHNYSNMGTALSGYVSEAASGIPFDQLCNQNIFDPLCMDKTAWHISHFDTTHIARPYTYENNNYVPYPHYGFADYPDGQLRSNILNLANFIGTILNSGSLGTETILTPTSINEMFSAQIPNIESTQGLNWYQEELNQSNGSEILWGHNGGEDGVSTDMYLDRNNNIGVCVITNGEGDALGICEKLYEHALETNFQESTPLNCNSITNVREETNNATVSIYPNFTNSKVNVVLNNLNEQEYQLMSVEGRIVKKGKIYEGQNDLDLSNLVSNVYILKCGIESYRVIKI